MPKLSKRQVDMIRMRLSFETPSFLVPMKPNPIFRLLFGRFIFPSIIVAFGMVVAVSIQLSAFEAHVLNVTAVIDRRFGTCDLKPFDFWKNNDGCSNGAGENVWAPQLNVLSNGFSGAFGSITGEEICTVFSVSGNCPDHNTLEGRRCLARFYTLGTELNLTSGHLDSRAILAGADNGHPAFDHLGLNELSTFETAVGEMEEILAVETASPEELGTVVTVGKRIHLFYGSENPTMPECVLPEDGWVPAKSLELPVVEDEFVDEDLVETEKVKDEVDEVTEEIVIEEVVEIVEETEEGVVEEEIATEKSESGSEPEVENEELEEAMEEEVQIEPVEEEEVGEDPESEPEPDLTVEE